MTRKKAERGITLVELVMAVSLMSVVMGIAVANIKNFQDPLQSGADQMAAYFRQVRARGMSATLAYTVGPTSNRNLSASYSNKCSDATKTLDSSQDTSLPSGATLSDTTWTVCFNSRGLPDANLVVTLQDVDGRTKDVEVYLGGAVKVTQ